MDPGPRTADPAGLDGAPARAGDPRWVREAGGGGRPLCACGHAAPNDDPAVTSVRASAPGKLILMGEHAVVYGRPALIAAVDLRLSARFVTPGPAAAAVAIRMGGLGHDAEESWPDLLEYARSARERWELYAEAPTLQRFRALRGDDPAHLVKLGLGEAASYLAEEADSARGWPEVPSGGAPLEDPVLPGLRLEVESEIPMGRGMGSSAAVAVSVVAGCIRMSGADPPVEVIERLALEVERRQHGLPSGVDGAAVLHGGLIWAERDQTGELLIQTLPAVGQALSAFRVFDTGASPQSTGTVVAAVRERVASEPDRYEALFQRMDRATRRFRDALLDDGRSGEVEIACLREYEASLEELGVVPGAVRELVRRVEAEGGAAKISGAGALEGPGSGAPEARGADVLEAPGAGCLLVYHPHPAAIASWGFLEGLERYPVTLGGSGLRLESE